MDASSTDTSSYQSLVRQYKVIHIGLASACMVFISAKCWVSISANSSSLMVTGPAWLCILLNGLLVKLPKRDWAAANDSIAESLRSYLLFLAFCGPFALLLGLMLVLQKPELWNQLDLAMAIAVILVNARQWVHLRQFAREKGLIENQV